MKSLKLFFIMMASVFISQGLFSQTGLSSSSSIDKLEISVLYDNYVCEKGTQGDWGFSCLIQADDQRILFDAGAKTDILKGNTAKLNTELSNLDQIIISHNHWDHVGGLEYVLDKNPDIPVSLPYPTDGNLKKIVTEPGGIVMGGDKAYKLSQHIWSSGTMDGPFREQCVVVEHQKGLIVITGCSHPGISKMLAQIKSDFGQDIYAVMGGFHLMQHSEDQVNNIISDFRKLGIRKCGSTHCTGDRQIQQFREAFGEDFIEMGTGRRIII